MGGDLAVWKEMGGDLVRDLAVWCQDNNLSLNVSKTKELIVDYRKLVSISEVGH